jgi:hypothetical protein
VQNSCEHDNESYSSMKVGQFFTSRVIGDFSRMDSVTWSVCLMQPCNVLSFFKNVIFWDVTPHASCKNRRFGGSYRLHHQDDKNRQARNVSSICSICCKEIHSWLQLLVTANVPNSILFTLMMEAIRSSETSVLTIATRQTSQKAEFFLVTTVKTSNRTYCHFY